MATTYRARDITDAQLVRDILEQSGIAAHVRGGDLQSGVGELPAGGLVTVWVDDADAGAAREVIARWERGEFALPDEDVDAQQAEAPVPPPPPARTMPLLAFVAGAILGALLVWISTHGPAQENAVDHDGDGRIDERLFVSPQGMERVETDRNRDGKIDSIVSYAAGAASQARSDDDFDGRFETRLRFVRNVWGGSETDWDGDGRVDYRIDAIDGVISREQWFDASEQAVKEVRFEHGRPRSLHLDSDRDGAFDVHRVLDELAEPGVMVPARG